LSHPADRLIGPPTFAGALAGATPLSSAGSAMGFAGAAAAAVVMPAKARIQIKAAVVRRLGAARAADVRRGGLDPGVRGGDALTLSGGDAMSAPTPGAVAPLNAKARGPRKAWRDMGFVGLTHPRRARPADFFPAVASKPLISLNSGTGFGIVSE
jgi:hypothetical protein